MTTKELRDKYYSLYEYMASSGNPKYMMLFGHVMNEMMEWMIENKPDAAVELIEKLCAIKWHNYLTPKEAELIVATMVPRAPWTRQIWDNAVTSLNLTKDEEPYYNSCALYVVMNMIYTDSAETIAMIIGKPLAAIPAEQIIRAVYALALDKLKDADNVFNVRSYFSHVLYPHTY